MKSKSNLGEEFLSYSGKGETVFDAITNIDIEPLKIKSKGIIDIASGNKKVARFFQLPMLRRIFVSRPRRKGWAFIFEGQLKNV